jgi:dolichol-phosphate mannosyltransferase
MKPPADAAPAAPELSVVVPVFNEEESLPALFDRLLPVLDGLGRPFEIVAVNDGSLDRSLPVLTEQAARRRELKIVDFRRNYGQTAALMAGFDHAAGGIIVCIDADLQNDPEDIPALVAMLGEGYDVVSGWRRDRKDAAIRRTLVSRLANRLISAISGVRLHDYGCTLKAYRAEVLEGVRLYGEMHRFIPIYAHGAGARIAEMPVRHHPRIHGKSKYGLERSIKVLLDLLVVKFLDRYYAKPMYVFGAFGLFSLACSVLATIYMVYLKFVEAVSFISTPLPTLIAITSLMGMMSLLMGLLAETMMRTYFESQRRTSYQVRERINFDRTP